MREFYLLLFTSLSCLTIKAQSVSTDTLDITRKLTYQKKLEEANNLLTIYNSNPKQYGLQLQAQVQYWLQDFKQAEATYQKATKLFPAASEIKLDYGRMLFELGKYKEASKQLKKFKKNSNNIEADLLLAKMELWNNHTTSAKERAGTILKTYPSNKDAKEILQMGNQASPLFLKLGTSYVSDDQPLNAIKFDVEALWNKSYLLSPALKIQQSSFSLPDNSTSTTWVKLENTFRFDFGKTIIKAGGGLFKTTESSQISGSLQWNQKLSKSFSFNSSLERAPYQYTLASISKPIYQQSINTSLNYNRSDKWLGSISYILQSYEDKNRSYTAYAWFLAPLINKKVFSLQAGCSSSYANSKNNTFSSPTPASVAAEKYELYSQIPGVYNPYITPQSQQINALLASLKIALFKNIALYARGSAGVFSKTSNPYLMLEQNESQYYISKNFSEQSYRPVEFESDVLVSVNQKLSLKATYHYSSLFYYSSNFANLQLNYRLNHE